MSYLESLKRSVFNITLVYNSVVFTFIIGSFYGLIQYTNLDIWLIVLIVGSIGLVLSILVSAITTELACKPISTVWQAVIHISPNETGESPNLDSLRIGRESTAHLVNQIYLLASGSAQYVKDSQSEKTGSIDAQKLLSLLPLPQIIIDKQGIITHANQSILQYLARDNDSPIGKHINSVLFFLFQTDDTLESWLNNAEQNKVSDIHTWERVRMRTANGQLLQFDLAASYSKNNPYGFETMLTVFDKTSTYTMEDNNVGYIAMAVHELRTPLTILRGYVELIDDEIKDDARSELKDSVKKISASTQSLVAFVNNILNVARIEEDALTLQLGEANWKETLQAMATEFAERAEVRGKRIELLIADNIPTVAIDKICVYEIVNNLVENAIKYSGTSERIIIRVTLGQDGMVETTVQDFGIGIPTNVMKNLFTKFYRSHRSKNVVGGNGLGLYIVRSLVKAHGGNVWVQSKEGEGSSFTFSLLPYALLKDTVKTDSIIERQAHGWIKNHSMYRR